MATPSVNASGALSTDAAPQPALYVDESPADQREARRLRQLRERHWTMLGLATVVVAASFLLRVTDPETVAPFGLSNLPLPPLCTSHALFGVDCPGCGLTRSFVALAHGDFAASFHFHHIGWVMALAVLAQFPYRMIGLREARTKVVERSWPTWCGQAMIALLIGNWLGKMVGFW